MRGLFCGMCVGLLWAVCPSPALATEEQKSPSTVLDIVADATTYDGKAHTYQMKGHVRVTLPQLVVTCDAATIFTEPASRPSAPGIRGAGGVDDRILRVVFSGQVEARKGSDTFRAERITYHVSERRLVAEGATRTRLTLPARPGLPSTGP